MFTLHRVNNDSPAVEIYPLTILLTRISQGGSVPSGVMTNPLADIEALLVQAEPIVDSTPTATLRLWRGELVRAAVFVSYAIGVLSLDVAILERAQVSSVDDVLGDLVNDLPGIMAQGWVGGGWSLSPDASASVAAAAEFDLDQAAGLLDLHAEMVMGDLTDANVVRGHLERITARRESLRALKERVEGRIRAIQAVIRHQYASGTASVYDWLR
jgi:hypothetical protein